MLTQIGVRQDAVIRSYSCDNKDQLIDAEVGYTLEHIINKNAPGDSISAKSWISINDSTFKLNVK